MPISNRIHDKVCRQICSMKAQAMTMYALVSSESAHVTMIPVMPSGTIERIAEAVSLHQQQLKVKRRTSTHKCYQYWNPLTLGSQ